MGKINLLDTQIANLISAGEVVERPASAVKELLENSIDAGADKITLEIKNGGISLIRITDNGCGMTKEDALVCIKRHATSKIKNADDLDGISTLGFRGEALAAISSVSKMRIMTRTENSANGIMVECDAGNVISYEKAGVPFGTTIIVEELFANVPARRKFLKRDISETAAVANIAEKIALSHPEIAFKFISNGNLRFATVGDGVLMNVIYSVLGREFAKKIAKVHDLTEAVEVKGFIGTPENCHGNRNYEIFYINGRYIKCQMASVALEQAFSSYIPSERFPCCILNLKINPSFVDVNVHPQKMEVKFSNDKIIFNSIYCAVRNTLMNRLKRPVIESTKPDNSVGDKYRLYSDMITIKTDSEKEAKKIADNRDLLNVKYEQIKVCNDKTRTAPLYEPSSENSLDTALPFSGDSSEKSEQLLNTENEKINFSQSENSYEKTDTDFNMISKDTSNQFLKAQADGNEQQNVELNSKEQGNIDTGSTTILPWFKIAGIIFNTYVFVEMENTVLVIDKHAAHERIIFERMRKNMKLDHPNSQILLLPIKINLTNNGLALAHEYKSELSKIGFIFKEDELENSVLISQYPAGLDNSQATKIFTELILQLSNGNGNINLARDQIYEKALYQASCKAAVKGGREDLPETIKWIVEKVISDPQIRYCPHGRPVAFEITKNQFEKRFERK